MILVPDASARFAERPMVWRWTWAIAGYGSLARIVPYVANRSLRFDEAQIALNLLRPAREMLRSLQGMQAAPIGFLLVERAAVVVLGSSELALRLFPLLASIAALLVFRALACQMLEPAAALLAVLLFACSEGVIRYAPDLKQYSSDVLVTVVLMWLALRIHRGDPLRHGLALLLVLGSLAVVLSQPACFVLAAIGGSLFGLALVRRSFAGAARIAALGAVWLAVFALCYRASLAMSDTEGLRKFWHRAFLPMPPSSLEEWTWLVETPVRLFREPFGVLPAALAVLPFLVGCRRLWGVSPVLAGLFILPMLAALGASAFELYPFDGRFLLFGVPLLAILVAEGTWQLVTRCARIRFRSVRLASMTLILLALLWHPVSSSVRCVLVPRPTEKEWRPALEHILARARVGDLLLVQEINDAAFRYYCVRLGIEDALVPRQKLPPLRDLDDPVQLAALRRRAVTGRIWFLFTYYRPRDGTLFTTRVPDDTVLERERIATYCRKLHRISLVGDLLEAPGATAFSCELFDASARESASGPRVTR